MGRGAKKVENHWPLL